VHPTDIIQDLAKVGVAVRKRCDLRMTVRTERDARRLRGTRRTTTSKDID